MRYAFRFLLIPSLAMAACALPARFPSAVAPVSIVIRDVTIVDVESGSLIPHANVTISGARISGISHSPSDLAPSGATVVDGSGRFLIPGLWDMHSHSLWSTEAMRTFLPLYVSQGVTGIRDMGGTLPVLFAYRDSTAKGTPPWPRVVAAGPILDGPHPIQAEISIPIASPAAATAAVDSLARSGVNFIKVYTLLPRDSYYAVLTEAHRLGLPVAGHIPADVTPEEASRAGQKSFEHLRDETEPFCSPDEVASCTRLAAIFHANDTWQVPTLTVLHSKAFFDDTALVTDPRLEYLPADIKKDWFAERRSKVARGKAYADSKRVRYAGEAWLTAFLAHEHVPLLAGTDAGISWSYPGFGLHDELELMVGAGLTPLEALRAATISPAAYLDASDSMGVISVAHVADLVLLRRNPLTDIKATREIEAVVVRGRLFDRRHLNALLDSARAAARN